jgi:hypothetical protein
MAGREADVVCVLVWEPGDCPAARRDRRESCGGGWQAKRGDKGGIFWRKGFGVLAAIESFKLKILQITPKVTLECPQTPSLSCICLRPESDVHHANQSLP